MVLKKASGSSFVFVGPQPGFVGPDGRCGIWKNAGVRCKHTKSTPNVFLQPSVICEKTLQRLLPRPLGVPLKRIAGFPFKANPPSKQCLFLQILNRHGFVMAGDLATLPKNLLLQPAVEFPIRLDPFGTFVPLGSLSREQEGKYHAWRGTED